MTGAIALAKQRQLVPVSHDLLTYVAVCDVRDASSAEEQRRVSTPLEKRVFDHHSCKAPSPGPFLHHPIPPGERQRPATSLARSLLLRFAGEQGTDPLLQGRCPSLY